MTISAATKILIIVPAYNEAGNIRRTIQEIRGCGLPVDILVIDDGSTDCTFEEVLATAAAICIRLPFNLGIGGAVQTGFLYAHRNGYDVAVQIDGDGQHDPRFLPELLRPLAAGQADLVIGSRFIPPFLGYRSSFVRRIGIHFFARLISLLLAVRITDPTAGFRAYGRRAIALFARDYPPDFPEPESIVTARRRGLTVVEVPVQMRARTQGRSSIRYLMTLYYMIKVTLAILLDMLKPYRGEG